MIKIATSAGIIQERKKIRKSVVKERNPGSISKIRYKKKSTPLSMSGALVIWR